MRIGILKEAFPGERRVALVPLTVPLVVKAGAEVLVEHGAGTSAGFPDKDYSARGATLAGRREIIETADVLLQVRTAGANPHSGAEEAASLRRGQVVIGTCEPLTPGPGLPAMAGSGVTTFALELIPRITRAQSMDVLSSMATIAGYHAVLLAATSLPRMFPMLMTAAGTLAPAKVFVVGAGVAGLQAIATARRLGAKVEAYDVRPAVKEQVQSLGAKFVELALETDDRRGQGRVREGPGRGVLQETA